MHLVALKSGNLNSGMWTCRTRFALYGIAVVWFAAVLLLLGPPVQRLEIAAFMLMGLASWSIIEYAMHRFVLHGFRPLRRWHDAHHKRSAVLIRGTLLLSVTLVAILVIIPALFLSDLWLARALSLGLLAGYAGYAITHQALHHGRIDSGWLLERKRWHVQYHHHGTQPGCYGVTSAFWDHVFNTQRRMPRNGSRDGTERKFYQR